MKIKHTFKSVLTGKVRTITEDNGCSPNSGYTQQFADQCGKVYADFGRADELLLSEGEFDNYEWIKSEYPKKDYTLSQAMRYCEAQGLEIPIDTLRSAFRGSKKLSVRKVTETTEFTTREFRVVTQESLDSWVRWKTELRDLADGIMAPDQAKSVCKAHAKRIYPG